jgi:pyruvate dehydrogenase E2 component (dihydrolipoamide acetyltransferase)
MRRYFSSTVDSHPTSSAPTAPGSSLKGETTIEEPDRAGRAIARRSAEVRATIPDLELSVDADAGGLLDAAERHGCSTTALVVSACAAALRECPRVNAAYRDGRYELYSRVNVAITLQAGGTLLAATVLDADSKSPTELHEELVRLQDRALSGELTPPEQAGATFTFSDLGPRGAHRANALITPPQAAALTAGAIRAAPVIRDGAVVAGHQLTLTLACDHRILFGAYAGEFLTRVAAHVEAAV